MAYDDYFAKYKGDGNGNPPEKGNGDYFSKYKTQGIDPSGPMQRVAGAISTSLLGTDTGYGESKYDKDINWFADVDERDVKGSINEIRAEAQSGLTQAAAIIPRAAVKAATEVAKIPGVVGGIVSAPFAAEGQGYDTAFNNGWIKQVDSWGEKINTDLMPIYTAKAVKEGNLWDNITSTSFWATEGADGIGFIAGMMAPGAAFEYIGLGGKLIAAASKSQKLARFTSLAGKAEEATKALKFMGITGKNIDSGLAVMSNTLLEAGAEAKGVGDDIERQKPQFVQRETLKRLAMLDTQRKNGQISVEQYNDMSQKVAGQVEQDFTDQRALAMANTFKSNVAILLGPNAIMHKAIWGKAAQKFEKTAEEGLKGIAKRAGASGKRIAGAFGSEGFWEEGSQTTVQNLFTKKALAGQLGKDDQESFVGEFTKEYINTLSTTDGQKAIFLGGALGGPMMSYSGRRADVANRKATNAILANIDSQITSFNDTFDNDIYKKNEDGSFQYKKDDEGNDTSERILDNRKVAEVARNQNFNEQQAAIFDFAVQTGNTAVVDQIKRQAIFNLVMPAVHNGEAGLEALEQKLKDDAKFNEVVQRDMRSDEKDTSENFVKDTLESAKWLQKQKERFDAFSKDVIQLSHEQATNEDKENFLNRFSASYLSSKYALRNAEKDLQKLEEKRRAIFEEAGADELYDAEAEFPTAKMKPGMVTDVVLEERAENTKRLLETNETLAAIDKERNEQRKQVEVHKKDIAGIWQASEPLAKAFKDYVDARVARDKASSEEAVQKADDFVKEINDTNDKDELAQVLLPQHATPSVVAGVSHGVQAPDRSEDEYNREAQERVAQEVLKSIREDGSTENYKRNLERLKALTIGSTTINKIIEHIETALKGRIEDQENFKEALEEVLEEHYAKAKEIEDLVSERQKKLDELIKTQQLLADTLALADRAPRGRNAKMLKALIAESEQELERVEDEIKNLNKELELLETELKQLETEIQYIYDRYNQVDKAEFSHVGDIVAYLNDNSEFFKDHRQDLGKLLAHKFGTERRIEEIEDTVDALQKYRDVLKEALYAFMTWDNKIKAGTNMADLKTLRDELLKTSKDLYNAKKDLKEHQQKLKRLNKAIIDKQALKSLHDETQFWEELQGLKEKRVHPLAKNPYIKQKIAEKEAELDAIEEEQKRSEEEFHQDVTEEEIVTNPEEVFEDVTPPVSEDEAGDYTSESIPDLEDEEEDDVPEEGDNMDEDEVDDELATGREGAKVISTNRDTGEPLGNLLQPFVDYERTPRDKSNDLITFEVGDVGRASVEVEEAYARLQQGKATKEDIDLLKDELPIKVIVSYKDKNGKEKKVFSFIEAKTDANQDNETSKGILQHETMPLRNNIIDQAVFNSSLDTIPKNILEGITSNIVEQFPGLLIVDIEGVTTYIDRNGELRTSNIPKNDIFSLQVFDGMTEEQKITYFQQNTGYVNWEGKLMSTLSPKKSIGPEMGQHAKGEIYLRIPQNNGKPYWLKLNVTKISEEKADAIYEIVRALSAVSQTVAKPANFQAMTVGQFFDKLDQMSPATSKRLQETLKEEIAFVKAFSLEDERNESLARFLDLIVYHKSENVKTGFKLSKDGNLTLGSLAAHLMDGQGFQHLLTITKDELDSPEAKEVIMNYLQYKRHNILVTKDDPGQFVFNNKAYVKYLLNSKDPLLSTNAVINQPTFQGYSNVYLNQKVKNSNVKPSQTKDIVPDTEWKAFMDQNHVSQNRLTSIANKVINNVKLTVREVAILQAKGQEIENIIATIHATEIAKQQEEKDRLAREKAEREAETKLSELDLKILDIERMREEEYNNVGINTVHPRGSKEYIEDRDYQLKDTKIKQAIDEKYNAMIAELTKPVKEIVLKVNDKGVVESTKNKWEQMKAQRRNPQDQNDVKFDITTIKNAFDKADEATKGMILFDVAELLGVSDEFTTDEGAAKLDPENLATTFNELMATAKKNNASIEDIEKICGL